MIYVCMLSVKRERTKPFICNYVNMIFPPLSESCNLNYVCRFTLFWSPTVLLSASIHLTHSDGDFKQKV